jgi:threonine dehydratase
MTDVSPTRADVLAAEALIRPHIRRTPVIEVDAADFGLSGAPVTFKLEFLQHSGTFKARGVMYNLLSRHAGPAGVVAASGGNHGAAVAWAAQQVGVPARIYLPTMAPQSKRERIASYGAEIEVREGKFGDIVAESQAWGSERGALSVHPYDQFETLAGQGTTALEFREQAPHLDTLLIAVGGGGLIGGMAAYLQGDVRLVGVEPEGCPCLHNALAAGEPVDAPVGGVAMDSLGAPRVGKLMFPLAQQYIERAVLVADAAIVAAKKLLWDRLRVVVEPGGSAALAALTSGAYRPAPGERVGVLLCGANTAVTFP